MITRDVGFKEQENDSTISENKTANKSPGISYFGFPRLSLIELHSYFAHVNASLLAEIVVTVWQPVCCTKLIF